MKSRISKRGRFLILIAAVILSGCSKGLSWTEDVRLPDGALITLTRTAEFEGGSSELGGQQTESRQTVEFRIPANQERVRWENGMPDARLGIVALWFEGSIPRILTTPLYVGDEMVIKCPNPPYLLFEYVSGRWRAVPWSAVPEVELRSNVTTKPKQARAEIVKSGYHLTAAQTSDSYVFVDGVFRTPYIVQLSRKISQTYGFDNCHHTRSDLIKKGNP